MAPAIRGSIKHHKPGYPLRPIVSCIGSALYNTSKFLTDILAPIQNCNGYSVSNSMEFAAQVANLEISDDEAMVSFDVVSLFTAYNSCWKSLWIYPKKAQWRHHSTLKNQSHLWWNHIPPGFHPTKQLLRLQWFYLQTDSRLCDG